MLMYQTYIRGLTGQDSILTLQTHTLQIISLLRYIERHNVDVCG
jgi:hypothetical protein